MGNERRRMGIFFSLRILLISYSITLNAVEGTILESSENLPQVVQIVSESRNSQSFLDKGKPVKTWLNESEPSSGALISPTQILTAAHVCQAGFLTEPKYVVFADGTRRKIKRYIPNPAFTPNKQYQFSDGDADSKNDFGIIELDEPVTHIKALEIISSKDEAKFLYESDAEMRIYGYGKQPDERGLPSLRGGIVRETQTDEKLSSVTKGFDILRFARSNGSKSYANPGDSGGPLIVKDHDGKWKIMGVMSKGGILDSVIIAVLHRGHSSIETLAPTLFTKHSEIAADARKVEASIKTESSTSKKSLLNCVLSLLHI